MNDYNSINLKKLLPDWKDINLGIVLLGMYILLDFGSFQGIFEIVNEIKLPFIVALISTIYAIYLVLRGRIEFKSFTTRIFVFLCMYIILYSIMATKDPIDAKADVTLFIQYLANYIIMIACVKKKSQYLLLIDLFIIGIIHSSFHSIMQGGKVWDSIWLRDENHISLICAYVIPYAFFMYLIYKSKLKKYFYIVGIVFFITAVLVAASRGGALAMIGVVFLCWLYTKKKIISAFLIMIGVAMVFSLAPPKFFTEMKTLEEGTEEATVADRIYLWGIAIRMFSDFPMLGVGPMNYKHYALQYDFKKKYEDGFYRHGRKRVAHSTPMQWLAEMGLTGSAILIFLQIAMFKNWRVFKNYKISSSGITINENVYHIFESVNHANAISQVGFWIAALFLSLMPYPFYWILIPFSETWKNIFINELRNG